MDALTRLHLGLTRGRELVGRPYLDDPELLAAYREHFSPMSYAKARAVLRELNLAGVRTVIDVGAGPGAMAQAAKELFPEARVIACDRSARALEAVPAGIERVRWDAAQSVPPGLPRAEVLLLGNVLNELIERGDESPRPVERSSPGPNPPLAGDAMAHVERIAAALLAEGGTIVIIEPALRETARALEETRDRLIDRGWFVVAPCLWRGKCPALARERDWCHEDRSEDETLKFAYLVLRRNGEWSADPRQWRVVSAKMEEKGREKLWACGVRGRYLLTRLDRHASDANAAWKDIARGDVVEIDGLEEKGDGLRLGKESRVRVRLPVVRG
jgi:ribosomal protein RSM22 (predicted rRNA methylase)